MILPLCIGSRLQKAWRGRGIWAGPLGLDTGETDWLWPTCMWETNRWWSKPVQYDIRCKPCTLLLEMCMSAISMQVMTGILGDLVPIVDIHFIFYVAGWESVKEADLGQSALRYSLWYSCYDVEKTQRKVNRLTRSILMSPSQHFIH